jgi:hypothetical protein
MAISGRLLGLAAVLAMAGWVGAPIGVLIGLLSVPLFLMMIAAAVKEQPTFKKLAKVPTLLGAIAALWFGSKWAGSALLTTIDWDTARGWYFGALAVTFSAFAVPVLCVYAYDLSVRIVRGDL